MALQISQERWDKTRPGGSLWCSHGGSVNTAFPKSLSEQPLRKVKTIVGCLTSVAYPQRLGLSAPSPGDDLRSKSAIRLRGQTVRSDSFWEIGCDFSAVTIRLRLRCILRRKMAKFASRCGNSLRFRLRFKKSLAIAVAMPCTWCT